MMLGLGGQVARPQTTMSLTLLADQLYAHPADQ